MKLSRIRRGIIIINVNGLKYSVSGVEIQSCSNHPTNVVGIAILCEESDLNVYIRK